MLTERILADAFWSFLLVLARVSGAMAFIPVPSWRNGPGQVRVIFSLVLTFVLYPLWPKAPSNNPGLGQALSWIFPELCVGLVMGIATALLIESFQIAAQIVGAQAGYSYASTIDPTSEADSSVLQVMAQLAASLLFFSFHLDAEVVRALAASYQKYPVGTSPEQWAQAESIVRLGTEMWKAALRLALPVVFLLMMVDLSLALLGRVQAQLQLLTLAFPAKMLATLFALAALAGVFPFVFREQANRLVLWLR